MANKVVLWRSSGHPHRLLGCLLTASPGSSLLLRNFYASCHYSTFSAPRPQWIWQDISAEPTPKEVFWRKCNPVIDKNLPNLILSSFLATAGFYTTWFEQIPFRP